MMKYFQNSSPGRDRHYDFATCEYVCMQEQTLEKKPVCRNTEQGILLYGRTNQYYAADVGMIPGVSEKCQIIVIKDLKN